MDNYFEALGVMAALKSGVAVDTLKRPLALAAALDELSNVFGLPGSDSRSQFDALRKSTGADAGPPG